ncbi:MAG TPA: thiamine pyrophosphate-requiring protein [Streptosporangiaceae bacterium]|nr:thiamine pyrophosphate-requiring protein [Streptosporangiaceae bacterium]
MNRYYTTSSAFLEALAEAGVSYVFANLGSDHPGIIEALAQARAEGRDSRLPTLITCPHETVALSAAHAYAAVTRRPQAVLVHVDAGTQNLGGAVNNAMRGRVPVLVFAGAAPYTMQGELPGGRNEFIHWVQDVHDQRGILRGYVKYDNEIRTGRNVKQLVHRALQIARSEPCGPVYLVGPREAMEEPVEPYDGHPELYPPIGPSALTPDVAAEIADALSAAEHPLIVTSYLGRNPEAVAALVELAELLAIPVLESAAFCVNFPADHPLHAGYQFTTRQQNPVLAQADVILVVDSDVPWIPVASRPSRDAAIFAIDIDPLKTGMSMWHIPARRFAMADSKVALEQIRDAVRTKDALKIEARRAEVAAASQARWASLAALERPEDGMITPRYLTGCLREALAGTGALVLTEAVTNFQVVAEHLRASRPGSLVGSGGGSLGFAGGGAIGAKLAFPERPVVCVVGDGSYLFGVPASAQWVARRYGAPSLTVIYDNRGWRAPKQSTLGVHPSGAAAAADDFHVSFEPEADLPGVAAAAGGAYAVTVDDPDALPGVLKDALAVVNGGRSAVVSVHIPAVLYPAALDGQLA